MLHQSHIERRMNLKLPPKELQHIKFSNSCKPQSSDDSAPKKRARAAASRRRSCVPQTIKVYILEANSVHDIPFLKAFDNKIETSLAASFTTGISEWCGFRH